LLICIAYTRERTSLDRLDRLSKLKDINLRSNNLNYFNCFFNNKLEDINIVARVDTSICIELLVEDIKALNFALPAINVSYNNADLAILY